MKTFLNLYLKNKFSFHLLNIVFAVIIPVTITYVFFQFSFRDMIIEGIFGIIMVLFTNNVMGGYAGLKKSMKNNNAS